MSWKTVTESPAFLERIFIKDVAFFKTVHTILAFITGKSYISSHLRHRLGVTHPAGREISPEHPICQAQGGKKPV